MYSEELRISVLPSDKEALLAIAKAEGEALAVIARRFLRRGIRQAAPIDDSGRPTDALRPEVQA